VLWKEDDVALFVVGLRGKGFEAICCELARKAEQVTLLLSCWRYVEMVDDITEWAPAIVFRCLCVVPRTVQRVILHRSDTNNGTHLSR
jgi:hypothetical protein